MESNFLDDSNLSLRRREFSQSTKINISCYDNFDLAKHFRLQSLEVEVIKGQEFVSGFVSESSKFNLSVKINKSIC